jgi:uncharacterized protein DUF4383
MGVRIMTSDNDQRTRTSSASRLFALVTGIVYVVLGLGGFLFGSDGHWGIFGAGVVLNLLRTVIGVLALVAARRATTSQLFGWVLFAALLALTVFGVLLAATSHPLDVRPVLDIRWADNILHAVTAVIGLVLGFVAQRRSRT